MSSVPNDLRVNDLSDLRQTAATAARVAGQVLLDWRGRFGVREKNRHDFVTDADIAAQQAIADTIAARFVDHAFLGEESPRHDPPRDDQFCWIVDPLDGTTNYVHGFPAWCVSIAVCRGQLPLAAAIFDPLRDELFTAAAGLGAALNGATIAASDCQVVAESLVATSLPATVTPTSPDLLDLITVATLCRGVRRLGSAALNLAYVASGRIDAFCAAQTHPWDVAAGVLLVREAGGIVTGRQGQDFRLYDPHLCAASTQSLHAELIALLAAG
jgi:myo-inositol-1(or 4)-monophosphatase